MKQRFPEARDAKRSALLQAVDGVPATFTAHADASETLRTLPDVSVQALTESGLFAMKCPAELGVPEVWIINFDSKAPELYELQSDGYERHIAAENGWLLSASTDIELRLGQSGKLDIRLAGNASTQEALPEEYITP